MDALLKHLVEITGHRDHTLLDISVVAALHELIGAQQARVLEVVKFRDQLFVRPRVWIEHGQPVTCEDGAEQAGEPLDAYPMLRACIEQHATSMEEIAADGSHVLWLPLWLNDKLSGCLEISRPSVFPDDTRHMMEGILSVYRNFQNLLDYSERDSLTGLLNRKTFDENFSKMVNAALPPDHPVAPASDPDRRLHGEHKDQWLAVVDIDNFKRVNDRFGHLYGDEVLILIANLLRNSFRMQDRIFRFGGEEFVILLRSTTLAEARNIFTRFRTNVENYPFPQVGQVTVSIGFASISQQTPVVILGHADQALYYAKTHGRNQVCHYDELMANGELESQLSNDSVEFF
ncbi:MAG: GGDEF domain-containing protein [Burkholderiaceae bacterium]